MTGLTISVPSPFSAMLERPHVVTLPDGARFNLPSGSTLSEGTDPLATVPPQARDLLSRACDRAQRFAMWSGRDQQRARDEAALEGAVAYHAAVGVVLFVEWLKGACGAMKTPARKGECLSSALDGRANLTDDDIPAEPGEPPSDPLGDRT